MLSRCCKFVIIWQKPNGVIYHRYVSGHYTSYYVGFQNSYHHTIIYILSDLPMRVYKPPFKLRVKRKLISYIEKM